MPRIFGLNIIAVLAAGIVFWIIGSIWYTAIFGTTWQALQGWTPAEVEAATAAMPVTIGLGAVVDIITAGFLGFILRKVGATGMVDAIKWALILCFGFVVMTLFYQPLYAKAPMQLFYIDAAYQVISFAAMAAVLTALDGVMIKD